MACYIAGMRWSIAAALLVAACSNRANQSKLEPAQAITTSDGSPTSGATTSGQPTTPILDDAGVGTPDIARPAKSIGIHLRSSPSGAQASVDGVAVGRTPTYWNGVADGRAHAFTFALAEHQVANYRFVPVTGGVIHARLVPLGEAGSDAGVPPTSAR